MTRTLKLPTTSRAKARAIVKLQLDRLSPIPARDILFDVAHIKNDGSDGLFALGVLRRADLERDDLKGQRSIVVNEVVDDAPVTFRFLNPDGLDDRERRWFRHAPAAAVVSLGLAAICLSGAMKAEAWRERRLPELAEQQRQAARADRSARQQGAARADWMALERSDAATRLLCAAQRLGGAAPGAAIPVTHVSADADGVRFRLSPGAAPHAMDRAGADVEVGGGGALATFTPEACP